MSNRKARRTIRLTLINLFFIVICVASMIPIFYAFSVSLNSGNNLLSSRFLLIPKEFTLSNYSTVLFEKPFFLWLKNSMLLALFTVIIALVVSVPAAYAFSRQRFKGRKFLLYILLLLNAFPSILSMFALYRLLRPMGLINSYAGLILIYTGTMTIFSLWNMKGYFDTIPEEIEEAGKIDGANDLQIMAKIVLPLAKPTIIVTAVMVLIFVWNEYIFAINFMTGAEKYTLAAGLYALQATEYTRNWPLFSAASLLASIPTLVIFFLIQKQMTSGLTAGGVKG
ncbi:MAG TPA: ABC transporter permease subunit [Clostridiales bacterium]|nr:ABC transporter permease subunit [Clostridiales bacterium]